MDKGKGRNFSRCESARFRAEDTGEWMGNRRQGLELTGRRMEIFYPSAKSCDMS